MLALEECFLSLVILSSSPPVTVEGEKTLLEASDAERGQGSLTFQINTAKKGQYEIDLTYSSDASDAGEFEIVSGDSRLQGKLFPTGGRDQSITIPVGMIELPKGPSEITLRAVKKPADGKVRLARLTLWKGFVSLFDGKSLDGWRGKVDGFNVENGTLICPKKGGGNIFTEKEYSDFVLRFEFQLFTGSNNGLGIRAPDVLDLDYKGKKDVAYVGMEIQILDSDDDEGRYKNIKPWQAHGSIYNIVPAKRGFLRETGKEWNVEEVIASGRQITVILNGTTIVDADLDEALEKLDEKTRNKHPGALREGGYIGFLGHGTRLEFRNLRIRELDGK